MNITKIISNSLDPNQAHAGPDPGLEYLQRLSAGFKS